MMISEIQSILNRCIDFNIKSLRRRTTDIKQLPKEFEITELRKQIQNNIESFSTFTETKRSVYSPNVANISFNEKVNAEPIVRQPITTDLNIDTPLSDGVTFGPSRTNNEKFGIQLPKTDNPNWWRLDPGNVINEDRKDAINIK